MHATSVPLNLVKSRQHNDAIRCVLCTISSTLLNQFRSTFTSHYYNGIQPSLTTTKFASIR